MRKTLSGAALAAALLIPVCAAAQCNPATLDGTAEYQTADYGWYYVMTGGKFPTGNIPNGDNASGGTFRFLVDDPAYGRPLAVWTKDDWFPENAGMALTLMDGDTIVYDNNGLEDNSYGDFYTWADSNDPPSPGLYRGYSMPNNWDWIYATYFKLDEATTFDRMIGYFDGNGVDGAELDPSSGAIRYRLNVFGAEQVGLNNGNPVWMPDCVSFIGNVWSTEGTAGYFVPSYTGVDRQFPPGPPYEALQDPIWRVEFFLNEPMTLPAGEYFFNNSAVIVGQIAMDLRPGSDSNQVNTNAKQLVKIALLSTVDFDAVDEVDIDSIDVRGTGVSLTRFDEDEDVNGDGLLDLVLYVRARNIGKPTLAECNDEDAVLVLTGKTNGGEPFGATDSVTWLGPDCK